MIPLKNSERGLIKMIIIILVALVLLAYFGFNLRSIVGSQTFQDNWNFLVNGIVYVWNSFLKAPASFIWNSILWPLFSKGLTQIQQGQIASSTSSVI